MKPVDWNARAAAVAGALVVLYAERRDVGLRLNGAYLRARTVAATVATSELFDVTRVGRHRIRSVNAALAARRLHAHYEDGWFIVRPVAVEPARAEAGR